MKAKLFPSNKALRSLAQFLMERNVFGVMKEIVPCELHNEMAFSIKRR